MKAHIDPEELMVYLDGELPVDEARDTATHVERCRDCQSLAADFQRVSRRLREWQIDSSNVQVAWEPPRNQRRRLRLPSWKWTLASVVALVVLFFFASPPLYKSVPPLPSREDASFLVARGPSVALDAVRTSNPLIVHTGALTVETGEFDKTRAALDGVLKRHQGYYGRMIVSTSAGASRSLEAVLRFPAAEFESAISDLKNLGRVESESRTGEEVTRQSVDLDAKLANAKNTESRLTDLLRRRATQLADVLAVEKEIANVREEIEKMEAQRKSLANRVDFATLTLTLTEDYRESLQTSRGSALSRFRNAAIEGYNNVVSGATTLALFLLSYGPSVLLWAAILFFPARLLWRTWRRTHP